MNGRLVLGAFVLGVIGGCSFQNKFEGYCATSSFCECNAGVCCVKEGRECSDELGCCSGLTCNSSNRCERSTVGGGGGSVGGGVGGGGGSTAVDAGSLRDVTLVVIDAGVTMTAGINLQYQYEDGGQPGYFCDGGIVPTRIHADGGITEGACCSVSSQTGLCTGATTCTLPGFLNAPGLSCCWCDQDCPEPPDDEGTVCPWNVPAQIDILVGPLPVGQLPPSAFCGDGGLKALGGCCSPDSNLTTCSFGTVSCSLDLEGSPCCLVAGFDVGPSNPPVLLNDCRVNGACDCNTTGGCSKNAGAICVDLVP